MTKTKGGYSGTLDVINRVILLSDLRTDGGCQMRARIDQDHVQTMAEAYTNDPGQVPAIGVLYDSTDYWVWDGNHRVLGAQAAGQESIMCAVEKGTARDAMLRAAGANATHGLPRSHADKRRAIKTLLADKTWGKRSDRWIADACHVSHPLVSDVRREIAEADKPLDTSREGRDGKSYTSEPANGQVVKLPPEQSAAVELDPGDLLSPGLAKKIKNTPAANDAREIAKLARLERKDPALAATVAEMIRDCEVQTVSEALRESSTPEDPHEEASDVLRQMLAKVKSVWRINCPKQASPALGASVLEQVADEWLNGGWYS